jgi:hypothetical protein
MPESRQLLGLCPYFSLSMFSVTDLAFFSVSPLFCKNSPIFHLFTEKSGKMFQGPPIIAG